MSLPLREVTTPFKGRGPFRNYGPFANKGPFGRNADYSFWNRRMFWNKAAYDAAPGGRKTLMSVAVMAALGFTFATSTSQPPGTVIGSDGTLGYGAHNLIAYSADFSQWSLNNSVTLNGAGTPIVYNGTSIATSQFVSNGTNNGPYKTFSVTPASGLSFTVIAYVRRVSGSGSVKIGSDAGSFVPVTLDPSTGGLSGGNATASGSLAVGSAWLVWATYTSAGTAPNAVIYGAAASTTFEAALAGVYGSKVLDYVATTSAAIYAPRITYDRGASSNAVPQSQDWATGWTKAGGNDSISGQSLVAGATSGSHALYRSVTMSAAQWTLAAEFVKGSQQATLGVTDGGTDYFAVLDTATGSIVSVQAGATARVEPSVAGWILSVTRTLANATVNAFWGIAKAGSSSFTGGGESVACNGMWTTLGPARGAYLRTFASVPLYTAGTPVQQNLLVQSADPTNGAWSTVTATVTQQTGTLPDGTTGTFWRVTATGTNSFWFQTVTGVLNCQYRGSLYIRRNSGSGTVVFKNPNDTDTTPTITSSWARITAQGIPEAGVGAHFTLKIATSGDSVDIFQPQMVEGTADLPYVATTGTPYSLYPQKSLLHEPARTRETTQPRDLTQAAWSKINITAAKTAIGLDQVANSCTTITSAAAGDTYIYQDVTSASANRLFHIRARARSATTVGFRLSANGINWYAFTATPQWQTFMISQASVTNPEYSINLRNSGDAIDVDFVQGEQYTTIPAVPPMPIWGTESAAQTLSADNIIAPTSYISNAGPQTTAMRFIPYMVGSMLLARQTNGFPLYMSGGTVAAYDSTNGVSRTITAGIPTIAASRYGSDLAISANGGSLSTASFDGSMGTANAAVGLGSDGAGGNQMWGEFLSLEIATAAATDAQLQAASSGTQA